MLYEGTGSIDYGLSARRDDEASVPGIDVIDIQPTSGAGMTLTITKTDPEGTGDYLRNIRILPEAVAAVLAPGQAAPLFNPDFVDRIRPFTVLRFMDWARANETSLTTWADRPRLEQARWTSRQGVPLEVMLALSNTADADPWLTIPHTADDDLVQRMAMMTLADLDPGRSLYVELSNEVWNAVMPQHDDALALARAICLMRRRTILPCG